MAGYTFPKFYFFPGYTLKPLLQKVRIPPIIAMIVMGCVARNFFGAPVQAYNDDWAQWIRMCCLAILLVRGGMNVSFTGKGLLVLFLTFIPLLFEATAQALVSLGLFQMPIEVCFAQGFAIASVAPAIVVPQLMRWNEAGYGRSKGIAGSLIASCTFDNITCLILFGVCKTFAWEYAA
jgi:Kef-type K+ transport system membrane component KefB